MNWLELSVSVDQEAAESVSELLARYGYNGGVVAEPAWIPGDDGPEFRYDPTLPVTLRAYLPLDDQADALRQHIEQALWHLGQLRPIGPLHTRTLADEDWATTWKQHYHIQRLGERIVIVPSWLEYTSQPAEVVLHLDPGMAFGTGLHPTTRLCLRLLEKLVHAESHILDLGTGSGILAIAAAKLGAASVLALDNDPLAVQVATENVLLNSLGQSVQVSPGSLGAGEQMGHWLSGTFGPDAPASSSVLIAPPRFTLICANLIARVLVALAGDLMAALVTGGMLVSSGIILERETQVIEALATAGLELCERHQEGEWVALVHRKMQDGR